MFPSPYSLPAPPFIFPSPLCFPFHLTPLPPAFYISISPFILFHLILINSDFSSFLCSRSIPSLLLFLRFIIFRLYLSQRTCISLFLSLIVHMSRAAPLQLRPRPSMGPYGFFIVMTNIDDCCSIARIVSLAHFAFIYIIVCSRSTGSAPYGSYLSGVLLLSRCLSLLFPPSSSLLNEGVMKLYESYYQALELSVLPVSGGSPPASSK